MKSNNSILSSKKTKKPTNQKPTNQKNQKTKKPKKPKNQQKHFFMDTQHQYVKLIHFLNIFN